MIRIVLPPQLRELARTGRELTLDVAQPVTQRAVLDALEARYPVLRGTLRHADTLQRRPRIRLFACAEDISHEPVDAPLPEPVATGREPLLIVAAISGG